MITLLLAARYLKKRDGNQTKIWHYNTCHCFFPCGCAPLFWTLPFNPRNSIIWNSSCDIVLLGVKVLVKSVGASGGVKTGRQEVLVTRGEAVWALVPAEAAGTCVSTERSFLALNSSTCFWKLAVTPPRDSDTDSGILSSSKQFFKKIWEQFSYCRQETPACCLSQWARWEKEGLWLPWSVASGPDQHQCRCHTNPAWGVRVQHVMVKVQQMDLVLLDPGCDVVHMLVQGTILVTLVGAKAPVITSRVLKVWQLQLPCGTAPLIVPQSSRLHV